MLIDPYRRQKAYRIIFECDTDEVFPMIGASLIALRFKQPGCGLQIIQMRRS